MTAEVHPTATVYPGTVLGNDVKVLENAVVGKQPSLSPRSTAKREPLPPTEIGDGTIVSAGAIVFAGSRIGSRVIVGDQACIRERVAIGDDVVVGRGTLVENDTTIGAMTRIQAEAYITAYSTLEEHVFIAPCVVTTNDNFMGRTERRHALRRGPRSAVARVSGAEPSSARESRSARRRSSAQAPSSRRTCRRASSWSETQLASCGTFPRTSSSTRSRRIEDERIEDQPLTIVSRYAVVPGADIRTWMK